MNAIWMVIDTGVLGSAPNVKYSKLGDGRPVEDLPLSTCRHRSEVLRVSG